VRAALSISAVVILPLRVCVVPTIAAPCPLGALGTAD
jgi:hypothetical protein